jgi:hypothetical protein
MEHLKKSNKAKVDSVALKQLQCNMVHTLLLLLRACNNAKNHPCILKSSCFG